jgi:hypothetical protein
MNLDTLQATLADWIGIVAPIAILAAGALLATLGKSQI